MEKRWIRAAVCQLGAESPDPGENLDRAEALVREAARFNLRFKKFFFFFFLSLI